MDEFQYVLDKIASVPMTQEPFPHLEIHELLNEKHWAVLMNDDQVHFDTAPNTEALVEMLRNRGYYIIPFPGIPKMNANATSYTYKKYKNVYKDYKGYTRRLQGAMKTKTALPQPLEQRTFRLQRYQAPELRELMEFLNSSAFFDAMKKRFDMEEVKTKGGFMAIQKYLSCYVNSPHADQRAKGLTFLFNANKDPRMEQTPELNLGLLKLKPEFEFCSDYWRKNQRVERRHIPWEWCDIVKRFSANNSLLVFQPSDDTLHAIDMGEYPHTQFQRTHILGALMLEGARRTTRDGSTYQEIARKCRRPPSK